MAESNGKRRGRIALTTIGAVSAAVGVGLAAERIFVRRDKRREDPYAREPYGMLRGTPVGPVASFDGTLLHVEEVGTGPTVILSHGFSLNSTLWHHQIAELQSEMRLVMYDHRGHGRSGRPPADEWTLAALARDLDAVIRECGGPGPVVVVGHSMGGMALLQYCDMFPDQIGAKVGGLAFVDTTSADVLGGIAGSPGRALRASLQVFEQALMSAVVSRHETLDRIRSNGKSLAYLGTRLMGFGPRPSPSQVMFLEQMLASVPSDVWVALIPAMYAFDLREVCPKLNVPTAVIVGDHDRVTPPDAARRMAAEIATAELDVIEGAGHSSMLEKPDEFNRALRRLVARVDRENART